MLIKHFWGNFTKYFNVCYATSYSWNFYRYYFTFFNSVENTATIKSSKLLVEEFFNKISRNWIAMGTNNKTFCLLEKCSYAWKLTNKTSGQLLVSFSVARKLTNKTLFAIEDYSKYWPPALFVSLHVSLKNISFSPLQRIHRKSKSIST